MSMTEERLQADEYEKQYYGFSSTELYEDFKEQVCDAIKLALKEIKTAFKEKHLSDFLGDQKFGEIYTMYLESATVSLEKFKEEARKIFAIPNNVILEEDKYNIDQYSDEDIIQLKKEVAELQKELLREQVFLAKCKHEKEIMDTIIKPLTEKVNSTIKFLKHLPENFEVQKNTEKAFDAHAQYIRYYFNNEATETEHSDILNVELNFVQDLDDFFK